MRRALVACLLHTTTAKQADTLLLREDQCGDALFVAHWTHVPKAGGTALAGLARRIACAKNPQIRHLNPCCIQDFCADHRTCEATATTSSNLCGALDFSKVDDVCGRLETRDVLLKKAAHDARCAHRGPGAVPRIADRGGLFSQL